MRHMAVSLLSLCQDHPPTRKGDPMVLGAHRAGGFRPSRTPPELTVGLPPPGPPWEVAALRVCMNLYTFLTPTEEGNIVGNCSKVIKN